MENSYINLLAALHPVETFKTIGPLQKKKEKKKKNAKISLEFASDFRVNLGTGYRQD